MTQNSLLLDIEIVYYQTMSKVVQYKRNFLKNRIKVTPGKILEKEVCA